eukprot:972751_1
MTARTSQKTRQIEISQQQSVLLMQNMLVTSVSTICYMRSVYDESAFKGKKISGVNVNLLDSKCGIDGPLKISHWMKNGVFDALEKKFLRGIEFSIFERIGNTGRLLESYNFDVTFGTKENQLMIRHSTNGGKTSEMRVPTHSDAKKMLTQMIRTLITLTSTLPPLPDDTFVTLRLFYNEDTPEDYEPECFRPTKKEEAVVFEEKKAQQITTHVGEVATGHHRVAVQVNHMVDDEEFDEYDAETPPEVPKRQKKKKTLETVTEEPESAPSCNDGSDSGPKAAKSQVSRKRRRPRSTRNRNDSKSPKRSRDVAEQGDESLASEMTVDSSQNERTADGKSGSETGESQPESGVSQVESVVNQQDHEMSQPESGTSQLESGESQHDHEMSQLESGMSQHD